MLSVITTSLPAGTLPEIIEPLFEKNFFLLTKRMPIHKSAKSQKIKKGKISDQILVNLLLDDERNKGNDRSI